MLSWIKNFFRHNNNIHVHVHVDGNVVVKYDRQNFPEMVDKGPNNIITSKKDEHRQETAAETKKDIEIDIDPSFFADTQETKVNFGNEIELPPTRDKDKSK